ncbi:plasmid mobilization protein [Intestinimonas massiliensis (ex Afouda et al. 2020)]|uniref:DUF1778 domain-containing protein n=1 Tax=Intestinimonas massiliensis (ex Afouda et al. 2020) TaxID=1673721 RepID=A0ABS9MES1_9FIRM|nr:DUF1778 domain-containing protein [Intestinimonas massiliensis (ex Afouda et al. 2020)]MCG4529306.1 DUF1778 domain-containing protein [Intestinimonas massiliensis (ex Afouda et al. 2020)]
MRNTVIQIRISEEEKNMISRLAEESHQSMTSYILTSVLSEENSANSITLRQNVARALCELNCLIEQVEDLHARKLLRKWEDAVWHF